MTDRPTRTQRRLAFIAAVMRVDGEMRLVTIANASTGGLMVRCDHPPEVGTEVELTAPGARIAGEVMWRRGRRFGLRSTSAVDVQRLFAARQATKGRSPLVRPGQRRKRAQLACALTASSARRRSARP